MGQVLSQVCGFEDRGDQDILQFYYREVERLASRLLDEFRFVDAVHMNDPEYEAGILSFVGIAPEDQVSIFVHVNQSERDGRQRTDRARFRPQHAT